ncbi:hypothetical protein K504DRAFT_386943 [Pleomassaria siparia CBS 279.74]|uniref:Uncharacterized protein n=1 Tax=Pleomassaria siparia CBS 279.74 TaxID=1314801 RepID=A0A6G1JZQ3_9PLEO|nr:hypothetical protein K504DRAFT_386943 [Pleomassaria siparia CBS 279.74]
MGARSARPQPSPANNTRTRSSEKRKEDISSSLAHPSPSPSPTFSPAPKHSAPVVIPPRTPMKTATSTQNTRARGQHGGRPLRVPKTHDPDAIPPAVAALLAVTAIPRPPARRRRGPSMERSMSMDELIKEWKQDHPDQASSIIASPLDILLGRVDESEDEYGSPRSMEQEQYSMTTRSVSSESVSTIPPSLDLDDPSLMSTWGDHLNTPDSYSNRREKMVQSPPKEDCILDHPLLHFTPDDCEELTDLEIADIVTSSPASSDRFKSFKSNLTASLQALKSAAKSFSNFTAPSVPPDDLLTRSLLSPRFTSEMRPKQLQGLPSPALRRYLNPQPTPISPSELSMQLHDSLMLDVDDNNAPMIQMQTYDRRTRSSSRKRRGSDPFSEAGRAASPTPTVRQREPRENSDFLRVIVLEMNMRRVGKLDAKAVGRARIWLPPRKLGSNKPPASHQRESGVPSRWVVTALDDV